MIPILLDIQGLYSYKEKQTVDFRMLTAAGIFGIFGAVGSGKSSILEAILLALYGSTERLADRGEKNSMLNLQSDQLIINFEFRAGPRNAGTYLARYAVKRNPKNFHEIRPAEHTFYEKVDGTFQAIEQKAETLLGMRKEHFKQTVIIPQGKFREFIDLTPGPRAEMMKELFGLERFDLAPRTGTLLKAAREEKIRLETQLAGFGALTEEALQEQRQLLKETALDLSQKEGTLKITEHTFTEQQALDKGFKSLQTLKGEWEALEQKKPEIEKQRESHQAYLKAKTYLKPLHEAMASLQMDIEKLEVSIKNCTRFRGQYAQQIQTLEEEEKALREKADSRPERESKIRDLQQVLEMQRLAQDLHEAQQQMESLRPAITEKEGTLSSSEVQIKSYETLAEKTKSVDSLQLSEWKTAYSEWDRLILIIKKLSYDLNSLDAQKTQSQENLAEQQRQLPCGDTDIQNWVQTQEGIISELETAKELQVQKGGLAIHTHLLKEGEPCPLCGSLDHPQPLEKHSTRELIEELSAKIQQIRKHIERTRQVENRLQQEKIKYDHLQDLYFAKSEELTSNQSRLKALLKNLTGLEVDNLEHLETKIKSAEKQLREEQAIQKTLKALRQQTDELRQAITEERKKLDIVHQRTLTLASALETKRDGIKDQAFSKPFFDRTMEVIEETISKVKKDIAETANKLDSKQKALLELRKKETGNITDLNHYKALFASTHEKLTAQKMAYQDALAAHGFADSAAAERLFSQSLDADAVEAQIRRYEDRCLLVQDKIRELEQQPGISTFDPLAYQAIAEQLEKEKTELQALHQAVTLLQQQVNTGTERLKEKLALEKSLALLEARETSLKELESLFKGSGFVKYVSSIYLKELCNTANIRFRKLTKNSLSLEIDENNTFWVADYLNGGRKRLLKTLSGGQTFQASLCLALALAEKVKSLNRAEQSFFFLDEGFGALDRSSLRIVFETLKSLRHENRVVGIISHVEELQQEIEVYAQITLDQDQGSQVAYSYS
ncbi:MAG: SMC family ATPase [Lunatimonas sp.]|uniref:AAA family ATPase n=1 Tax=Lunatimonas sp. TaxID=2060141 RepID=UPI00263B0853|nr:SMC family ATPase [Lunatimonas sp.]MCC5939666.1 SMC family ATPase [Lunatimonas sp.]